MQLAAILLGNAQRPLTDLHGHREGVDYYIVAGRLLSLVVLLPFIQQVFHCGVDAVPRNGAVLCSIVKHNRKIS
jgi:hypothetical protein